MRPPDVELGRAIFAFKGAPENFLAGPPCECQARTYIACRERALERGPLSD